MVDGLSQDNHRSSRIIPLVLIVDDNQDNLLFISCILDSLNIKFISADNSGAAISLAINEQPDLIFLDMVMPEIDGMEITRRLKQNSFTEKIPIVAVTGLTLPKHREAIERAGCNGYIGKPFLIEEVEAQITRFLNLCLI
ncbi:MAG: PleD family two-component system response regulator [Pleurocapsa sp.]